MAVTPPWHDGEMLLGEVHELVERVARVDGSCADWVLLQRVVADVRRLKSWVEGREVAVARFLAGAVAFPSIPASIAHAMDKLADLPADTLENLLEADRQTRLLTEYYLAGKPC